MSIYFGSTTDGELISELAQRGYLAIPLELESVAFRLAEKELAHLSEENLGVCRTMLGPTLCLIYVTPSQQASNI